MFRKSRRRRMGIIPRSAIWTLFNEGWGIDLDDNPGRPALADRDLRRGEGAGPRQPLVDNSPCFPRNYHLKTDIEDFHWYNGFPAPERRFRRDRARLRRPRALGLVAARRRRKRGDEPLVCSEFGVWGLPHPREILEKDGSEPWWFESGHDWNDGRRLSARDRDAFPRRRARADLRRSRRLRRRGAGAPVSGAEIPDRDAALGAADLRLRDHRAQRRAVGIERPHGRPEPPARLRRAAGQSAAAVARHRAGAAHRHSASARASRSPSGSRARSETPEGASSPGASADQSGRRRVGAEPTTIALTGAARRRDRDRPVSNSKRAIATGACCRATRSSSASSRRSARAGAVAVPDRRRGSSALAAIGWPNRAATPDEAEIVAGDAPDHARARSAARRPQGRC